MRPSFALRAANRTWTRLVRFRSGEKDYYGEPILPRGSTRIEESKQARIIDGSPFDTDHTVTQQVVPIDLLHAPVLKSNINSIRCLGLNYTTHAKETDLPLPEYPILFYKPRYALTSPRSPVFIPPVAQKPPTLDYECELVVVIGQRCKDITEHQAPSVIAGYSVGNDISHREWQLARGGGQWGFGKGFDAMTPFGPGIVRPAVLGAKDPGRETRPGKGLRIWTRLNGEVVQEGFTGDMVFGVAKTVAFLSQGTTLFPGDLIFMGTPSGVGMARNPPLWLKHGDFVEVGLEDVGSCANYINFEGQRWTPRREE